jgi:hypothetical protein
MYVTDTTRRQQVMILAKSVVEGYIDDFGLLASDFRWHVESVCLISLTFQFEPIIAGVAGRQV